MVDKLLEIIASELDNTELDQLGIGFSEWYLEQQKFGDHIDHHAFPFAAILDVLHQKYGFDELKELLQANDSDTVWPASYFNLTGEYMKSPLLIGTIDLADADSAIVIKHDNPDYLNAGASFDEILINEFAYVILMRKGVIGVFYMPPDSDRLITMGMQADYDEANKPRVIPFRNIRGDLVARLNESELGKHVHSPGFKALPYMSGLALNSFYLWDMEMKGKFNSTVPLIRSEK